LCALNIEPKRLYKWQKEVLTPVAAICGAVLDPATAAELSQLQALARRQGQEFDILKSHRQLPAMSARGSRDRYPMSRYRFSEAQRGAYPARRLCYVLGVPASGYYAWQQAQQQMDSGEPPAWEEVLVKVFGRHKRRYGTRRLRVALRRKGYRLGRQRLLFTRNPSPAGHRLTPFLLMNKLIF